MVKVALGTETGEAPGRPGATRENIGHIWLLPSLNLTLYVVGMPVAGKDYPSNLMEFQEFFPTEAACRRYLAELRWPQGFVCPKCGEQSGAWDTGRGLLLCRACRHQCSVTAGTIFEGTRTPLRTWLLAAWEVTSHKYGASALGVQHAVGLPHYKTAWAWLHKLRRAMVRPDRERLFGEVEVDETYVGGEQVGVRGRGTNRKALVAVAVEVKPNRQKGTQLGRVRLRRVCNASEPSLLSFVTSVVEPGTVVCTDGWRSYGKLATSGYPHRVTVGSGPPAASTDPLLPHVHQVASLLKRWLLGTHQGAVSREHLDYYLDEFTFRFNRRTSRARGLLFYRLLDRAVRTAPATTASLFRGTNRGKRSLTGANHKMLGVG